MLEANRVADDVGRKSVALISLHQRIIDQQQLTCPYPEMYICNLDMCSVPITDPEDVQKQAAAFHGPALSL